MRTLRTFLAGVLFGLLALPVPARTPPSQVGVVLMHGMTGHPMSMSTLAHALKQKGYLVSNLEMPWSMARMHDAPVEAAERMVQEELEALRRRGARKLFIAGFSKGGLFAAYFATRHPVDGLIDLRGLPAHPLHRLYEPDATHSGAVNASADEAVRWIAGVVRNSQLRSR